MEDSGDYQERESSQSEGQEVPTVGSVVRIRGLAKKKEGRLNGRIGVVRELPKADSATVELPNKKGSSHSVTVPFGNLEKCTPATFSSDPHFPSVVFTVAQAAAEERVSGCVKKLEETVASLRQELDWHRTALKAREARIAVLEIVEDDLEHEKHLRCLAQERLEELANDMEVLAAKQMPATPIIEEVQDARELRCHRKAHTHEASMTRRESARLAIQVRSMRKEEARLKKCQDEDIRIIREFERQGRVLEEKIARLEKRKQLEERLSDMRRQRADLIKVEERAQASWHKYVTVLENIEKENKVQLEHQTKNQIIVAQIESAKEVLLESQKRNEAVLDQIRIGKGRTTALGVWQFKADDGSWTPFAAEQSDTMMQACISGQASCSVTYGGALYEENFDAMLQKNTRTGKDRQIRCRFGLPPHWHRSRDDALEDLFRERVIGGSGATGAAPAPVAWPPSRLGFYEMVVREGSPAKLTELSELLSSALRHDGSLPPGQTGCDASPFKVLEAFHVENMSLYTAFLNFCRHMQRKHVDHGIEPADIFPEVCPELLHFASTLQCSRELNERMLFHGTLFETAKQIAVHGFDSRLAQDGYFGRGTYFASQSCKSAQYGRDGTIILSRVALGDPFYTPKVDRTMRRPPSTSPGAVCGDSVIARPGPMDGHHGAFQTHMEFVIFEQLQAYPEYIIRYTR
mmetsp:Transcript_14932/g.43642  ORF Transcript_14932/g.43642 Transcript_14932/m.43642 type:complete len:691 (+) Transcript_14932:60-2132(+)